MIQYLDHHKNLINLDLYKSPFWAKNYYKNILNFELYSCMANYIKSFFL